MEETAKKIKQVVAILMRKKTYTLAGIMYMKNIPMPVDIKTAKYLRNTGIFSFKKLEAKDE